MANSRPLLNNFVVCICCEWHWYEEFHTTSLVRMAQYGQYRNGVRSCCTRAGHGKRRNAFHGNFSRMPLAVAKSTRHATLFATFMTSRRRSLRRYADRHAVIISEIVVIYPVEESPTCNTVSVLGCKSTLWRLITFKDIASRVSRLRDRRGTQTTTVPAPTVGRQHT